MLKGLYDYAIVNQLLLPEGYKKNKIKAYILLYPDGSFQGVELGRDEEIAMPDVGTLSQSTDKCGVLAEKRKIVVSEEPSNELKDFVKLLNKEGKNEPRYLLCAKAIETKQTYLDIRQCFSELGLNDTDRFSFKIKDKGAIEESEGLIQSAKAYILLDEEGNFLGIETTKNHDTESEDQNDISDQGKDGTFLQRPVGLFNPSAKSEFFLSSLKKAGEAEPNLALCAAAIQDKDALKLIRQELDVLKIKDSDKISFKVRNKTLLDGPKVQAWWESFRKELSPKIEKEMVPCLITGNPVIPVNTTQKINGLFFVGGHASGDSLICFDKNSFCSYDLEKANNAPVSEEAMAAVKAALDDLLAEAPILAGMKVVHWYDAKLPRESDPIRNNLFEERSGADEEEDAGAISEQERELIAQEEKKKGRKAKKSANALINSVMSDERASIPKNFNYYILMLSGVGGRVMIRRYDRGNYHELVEKLRQWQEDLSLCKTYKDGLINSCALKGRLIHLLSYQKTEKDIFKRLNKELSGCTPSIIEAILSGSHLPDVVASKALAYIRSAILGADEDQEGDARDLFTKDASVWQWLKAWLLRNKGKRGILMSEYNGNYVSRTSAYHCGAMLAVYEALQKMAMPDVNVTVAQRFYASAIQTPALVLGRLSQMSIHHLAKIENENVRQRFQDRLNEVSTHIQGNVPTILDLEAQSEFALGYYQMNAKMESEKREAIAKKKGEQ